MIRKVLAFFVILNFGLITLASSSKVQFGLGYYFQVFLSLVFVLGLIFFGSKIFSYRLQRPKVSHSKIIDFINLEPQVNIYKIELDNQQYVIGVGNKQIVPITTKNFSDMLFEEEAKKS